MKTNTTPFIGLLESCWYSKIRLPRYQRAPRCLQAQRPQAVVLKGNIVSMSIFCVDPFLTTSFLVPKPQPLRPNQPAGRDKFSPLDSPFAPFSIRPWAASLQAVDHHPTSHRSAQSAFPDHSLLICPTPAQYQATL